MMPVRLIPTASRSSTLPLSHCASVFICSLESFIAKLATGKTSISQLVSVAEQTGLSFHSCKPQRQIFLQAGPNKIDWALGQVEKTKAKF